MSDQARPTGGSSDFQDAVVKMAGFVANSRRNPFGVPDEVLSKGARLRVTTAAHPDLDAHNRRVQQEQREREAQRLEQVTREELMVDALEALVRENQEARKAAGAGAARTRALAGVEYLAACVTVMTLLTMWFPSVFQTTPGRVGSCLVVIAALAHYRWVYSRSS